MDKAISKSYTLDCSWKCPCTFPHIYAQPSLGFDKNYSAWNILLARSVKKLGKMKARF